MDEIAKAYASTLRASVRRGGEWHNLNYSHHLGHGAKRMAALSLTKLVDGFSEVCKLLVGDPEFREAADLITQCQRVLRSSFEDLLRKVQLMAETSFGDALKVDPAFWALCNAEWGRGSGYRDRVAIHNDKWFKTDSRINLEKELRLLISREWDHAIQRVSALLDIGE